MRETEFASSNSNKFSVQLPPNFDRAHRQIFHCYLQGQELSGGEAWSLLIQTMDILRRAEVIQGEDVETFAAIYDRLIDAKHTDQIIDDLLASSAPEAESESLRASVARLILADLRAVDLWRADVPESQTLVGFCLYWWQMFVRGYAFEIAIYRDLASSGVIYTPHDLRNRQTRLSEYDLTVMNFRGDVKTSTYFVQTSRSQTLRHDFYITRMYHREARQWYRTVWLKLAFWQLLNGTPTPVDYHAIWQVLPGVAQITLYTRQFVVVLYEEWKQRLIARQAKGKKDV
jgi:hypothetical protein